MAQKTLTLSIIIPAYNEEHHLKGCLEAISVQSETPEEVLVIDNNSSDETAKIARQYPFVTLLNEKQQGLFFARRRGMDAASGDILCRIDADTIIDSNWVSEVKLAFKNSLSQAISGPVGYHDMPFPNFTRELEDRLLRTARLGRYKFLMGANMAIRRSAWELVRDELCNQPFIFEDIDIAIHLERHNISPAYFSSMKAAVSSRRFQDNPVDFMRYIGGHTRTLEYHNRATPLGVHFAEGVFTVSYVSIKPLHMMFDPSLRRPSLSYLLQHRTPRPDPMVVN